jgi:hypothetical protein
MFFLKLLGQALLWGIINVIPLLGAILGLELAERKEKKKAGENASAETSK